MDPAIVAALTLLAAGLAITAAVAISRGRELDAAREAVESSFDGESPAIPGSTLVDDVGRLRRRAEAAEYAQAQRLRDLAYLADLVGVGIVRLTDDLRIEVANTAAHVYLGRPAGSMVGRTAIEGLADHRIEAVAARARELGSATEEVAPRGPDGPALIVRARRSPILGVWLVLQDVAELRRLQRIRAEFVDNLSHELRTPIATIGLLAETLANDADQPGPVIPERMRERIGKLEVQTANVAQMIAELLDLARIESGGPQPLLDDVDVREVVTEAVDRLRTFADRQGIDLQTVIEPGVPAVRGEATRLAQVVSNLVHNAVKFSPSGSTVEAGVRAEGERVLVWVRDTGIGIDPLDQPRIFERFYKADRTRTRAGGTGLGLAIARHIVEGHGGSIAVSSTPGEGSTFSVSLPAAPAAEPLRGSAAP